MQNNPLSYTDPSGFFLKGLFKAIGNFLRAVGRAFVHAARAIARSTIGRAILQIVACATTGPIGCAATSAALTLAAGGSIKQALIGAAIAFVQIGAYTGIHQVIGGIANSTAAAVVKVGLHAVVGGAVSVAQGGSFETGALTGAVAAGSSLLMDSSGVMGHSGDGNPEYIAERTAVSAIAGGTASVLSGGKFANGAITGAFAQLYNDAEHGDQASGGAAGMRGKLGSPSGRDYKDWYSEANGRAEPSSFLEDAAMLAAGGLVWARGVFAAATEAPIIGQSFGKLGSVVANPNISVTSMSSHAVNQAITRRVSTADILYTVRTPSVVLQQSPGNYLFLSQRAAVVLNSGGRMVTTYSSAQFDANVANVLARVPK